MIKRKIKMKTWNVKLMALTAVMMLTTTTTMAQTLNDSVSADTTKWYNQTQQLGGLVVKGRLPKTRAKGDAMRTTVAVPICASHSTRYSPTSSRTLC